MKVTLLSHTPEPERLVACAAKLCYASGDIASVEESLDTPGETERFLGVLASMGHESPVEHAVFTFGVEDVSRTLLAQLTRHRLASYSVRSQRYVSEMKPHFVTPPAIAEDPESANLYDSAMADAWDSYAKLAERLREKARLRYIADGVPEKKAAAMAEKTAIEDARYVLPNACATQIILTMNVRSLFNFFRQRCCNRAQWEIRALAEEMLAQCRAVAPSLFARAGAPCVSGDCPEGKMTCGHPKSGKVQV